MDPFDVEAEAKPHLLRNDLSECEKIVSRALKSEPHSPFHLTLESEFTNDPSKAAAEFTAFFSRESEQMHVAAIYTETNGFSINPDRWYFELFGYPKDQGLNDLDWLSEWQSADWPSCTLTGMEKLQEVYDTADLDEFEDAADLASLLVVIKFQKLIHTSRPHMTIPDIPVYSTGHDFDFIATC